MSATVADYQWWGRWRPSCAEAHCVTLVSDHSPQSFLDALDALVAVPEHEEQQRYGQALRATWHSPAS